MPARIIKVTIKKMKKTGKLKKKKKSTESVGGRIKERDSLYFSVLLLTYYYSGIPLKRTPSKADISIRRTVVLGTDGS